MYRYSIPTCYFPSTVVFVDDSREFLMNFTLQLDDDLAYRIFDSPYEALDAIYTQKKQSEHFSQRCMTEYLDSNNWPMTNQTVNVDLAAIHYEVYNPQRFGEISVVVVDYAMPGMNGLEFCRRIENDSIKKILLTGQADEKTAIEAFNAGIIHRFIQKGDPNVTQNIMTSIHQLQRHYFQNMSDMVVRMLSVNSPNCLQDEKFAEFFRQLRADNNIVEFYLTENSGSFLMLDADGNLSYLIMKHQNDLKLHYDLALDNKAPQDVLDVLKTGAKIPCFWQSEGYHSEWTDWSTCLVPAHKLVCDDTYYYAYLKSAIPFEVRRDKISSYNEFLKRTDLGISATTKG